MGRALRRQFALYYAMPVLPAGIIGVAFVRNLGSAAAVIIPGNRAP